LAGNITIQTSSEQKCVMKDQFIMKYKNNPPTGGDGAAE
jgi:hypothetical protein